MAQCHIMPHYDTMVYQSGPVKYTGIRINKHLP